MATIKIKGIKRSSKEVLKYIMNEEKTKVRDEVQDATNYIMNGDKTNNGFLVSGYNVNAQTSSLEFQMTTELARNVKGDYRNTGGADISCYHVIQSFSPDDNITAEEAHEIGQQLMREMLGGEYEYVIATHTDKEHIHNHIVFNATSFYTQTKFRSQPYKTVGQLRAITNKITAERGYHTLPECAALSSNYQQYQKYRNQTTYRVQLRKRLNFLLSICQDVDTFVQYANDLGIEMDFEGKHDTYRFAQGNQQRNTRAEKLSDDDRFTFEAIKEKMEENKHVISLVQTAIQEATTSSTDLKDFEEKLKQEHQITLKKNRQGEVTYTVHGVENKQVRELALNQGYTLEKVANYFDNGIGRTEVEAGESIVKLYEQQIQTNAHEVDSPVLLDETIIKDVSEKGLLLKAEHLDGSQGEIFIEASQVDFDDKTQKYVVHLGDQFNYYFMRDGKQLNFFLKGEQLLRQLEQKMNVPTEKILLPPETFQYLGEKGLTITLDYPKIERLFLPREYVHVDNVSGSVSVELSKNWNYYYQKEENTDKRKAPLLHIKGSELLWHLKGASGVLTQRQTYRMRYAERKEALTNVNTLSEYLSFLSEHHIQSVPQLKEKIENTVQVIQVQRQDLMNLKEKISAYNTVAKYLVTIQEKLPMVEEVQQATWNKAVLREEYKQDLQLYNHAVKELEKRNISPTVETEKVVEFIKENRLQEKEMQQELKTQEQLLQQFQTIQELLTEKEQKKPKTQEKQQNKSEQEK